MIEAILTILRDMYNTFKTRALEDDQIDVIIEERGVKDYRPGMEKPDYNKLSRFGSRNSEDYLKAEENLRRASLVVH